MRTIHHRSRAARWLPALTILAALAAPSPARADATEGALPGARRIGVRVQAMTPELRRHFEAPEDRGLLVGRVDPGRPAARAGLRVGDVILAAGGEPQRRPYDLIRVVGRAPTGKALPLEVLRDGKRLTLSVEPEGAAMPWPDPGAFADWLERGLEMGSQELLEQLRRMEQRLEELEKAIERGRRERDGSEGAERT